MVATNPLRQDPVPDGATGYTTPKMGLQESRDRLTMTCMETAPAVLRIAPQVNADRLLGIE